MLKRISVEQAAPGMFVHALDAPWVSHPFWCSRFTLHSADDVRSLRQSGVAHCWIDVSRGADVAAGAAPGAELPSTPAQPGPVAVPVDRPRAARPPGASAGADPRRAERLAAQARDAVRALFVQARAGQAICLDHSLAIVDELAALVASQPGALVGLARLKSKDDYTFAHSVAVCTLMIALARQIGMGPDQVREAGMCGLLHDVGKLLVPRHILDKPGKLTPEEFGVMQRHPQQGVDILRRGGHVPDTVIDVCLHHHEKLDGSGYPHGLAQG
ncbi:HD-GYP domain-containing protein [Acidovorax sp. NPDC077693]|uniref:HD-GYP domain-containing protein n=1 Tax=unclassified Acidovorax TaxID=2684926 RepID=UPI0037C5CBF1